MTRNRESNAQHKRSRDSRVLSWFLAVVILLYVIASVMFGYVVVPGKVAIAGIPALILNGLLLALAWTLLEERKSRNSMRPFLLRFAVGSFVVAAIIGSSGQNPLSEINGFGLNRMLYVRRFVEYGLFLQSHHGALLAVVAAAVSVGFIGAWLKKEMPRTALAGVGLMALAAASFLFCMALETYSEGFQVLAGAGKTVAESAPGYFNASVFSYAWLGGVIFGIGAIAFVAALRFSTLPTQFSKKPLES